MDLRIVEESAEALEAYGEVPIVFEVKTELKVELVGQNGLGGIRLVEEKVTPPFIKDYDGDEEGPPARWQRQWDLSNWAVISAFDGEKRVGGAVLAFDTEALNFLEGRNDLAALWDIRVAQDFRGLGLGAKIFERTESWSRERGCALLKIETQNINVAACRFYASQGCRLGSINPYAYRDYPDEVQLIWYKDL